MNEKTNNDKNTSATPATPSTPIGAGVAHDDKSKTATMTPPASQPAQTDAKPAVAAPQTPTTPKV